MTAIIKNRFRIQNAKDFLENLIGHPRTSPLGTSVTVTQQPNGDPITTEDEMADSLEFSLGSHARDRNLYLFIGQPSPWPNNPPAIGDLNPPLPLDTIEEEARIWESMLGCKKVTEIFGSLVVPRHDWDATGETVYKPFDDRDPQLFYHPTPAEIADGNANGYTAGSMYIITDEFHVFKCLDNNRGAKSTDKPQKPLSAPFQFNSSVDGYRWKYMTTVTPAQTVRFLTDRWLPVVTLKDDDGSTQWLVQQAALSNSGAIETMLIDSPGSGYSNVFDGLIDSAVDATHFILPVGASVVDNAYNGTQLHIIGGTGAGAIRNIISYVGATREIEVDAAVTLDATSDFQILPQLVISGNGSGAIAKPIVETTPGPTQYQIIGITILASGSGYTFASATISGAGGVGAVARPVLSGPTGHGADIEQELGAFFAMVNSRLQYNEGVGDFPISNDYRQLGLIRDLKNLDGSLAFDETRIATKKISLTGISGSFNPDDTITGTIGTDVAVAKVLDFIPGAPGEGTISFFQNEVTGTADFLDGMALTGPSGSGTLLISGAVTDAEIKKFDGQILYVENRRPILRAPDLIEDIKAIVEF